MVIAVPTITIVRKFARGTRCYEWLVDVIAVGVVAVVVSVPGDAVAVVAVDAGIEL